MFTPRSEGCRLRWRFSRESLPRNSQDEIRVGREAKPNLPLTGADYSGKIPAKVQKIGDELKVQVWCPSAIHLGRADGCQALALCKTFTDAQSFQGFQAEVAIESKENCAVIGGVLQDDDRPVVEGR